MTDCMSASSREDFKDQVTTGVKSVGVDKDRREEEKSNTISVITLNEVNQVAKESSEESNCVAETLDVSNTTNFSSSHTYKEDKELDIYGKFKFRMQ